MPKGRQREPRVMVLCSCGAVWYGRAAVDNPVITSHRARCGPPITPTQFETNGRRFRFPQGWTAGDRSRARRSAITTARRAT